MSTHLSPKAARGKAALHRGLRAEALAALWLRLKGYRILAQRLRTPLGEIDLVVQRGPLIAFVEVKARASYREGLEAVSPRVQARLVAAARYALASRPAWQNADLRFDVVALGSGGLPHHCPDAFRADDVGPSAGSW